MKQLISGFFSYWSDFLDLLFPRLCVACTRLLVGQEQHLCTSCQATLPRASDDSLLSTQLPYKLAAYPEVCGVDAYLVYRKKGRVQRLLHALKYKKQPEAGMLLGRLYGQELLASGRWPEGVDLIVPVPLHPRKYRQRGYNQSDCLAQGLSESTGVPWQADFLRRTRYTASQTGKNKSERWENVKGIFELTDPNATLERRRVILVDDVLTTGATLQACVDVLVKARCKEIYIMTLAAAQS